MVEGIKITAENHGVQVKSRNEAYTSITCSLCGERHRNRHRYRGLYTCKTFNKVTNANVNAVVNMIDNSEPFGRDNWVVANPSVVKATVKPSNPFRGVESMSELKVFHQ